MLRRASKRSLPQQLYTQSAYCLEGLRLPFLCPALYRPSDASRRLSKARHPRPRSTGKFDDDKHTPSYTGLRSRHLASAAAVDHTLSPNLYVPWERATPGDSVENGNGFGSNITSLRPFDPETSPIVIKDALSAYPKKFRVSKDAISGDINEIHQTLHACLQVGRFERAAALVRRLNQIYKPDAPGLLVAHKDYIGELTHRIVRNMDQYLLQHLHKWFQVDLKKVGIEPDDAIYGMMIRASLQASDVKKDRTVRRYVRLAREAGFAQQTQDFLSAYEDDYSDTEEYFLEETTESSHEMAEDLFGISKPECSNPKDEIDEVREVDMKGTGLSTLKKTLSIFSKHSPAVNEDGEPMSPVERQRSLELDTVNAAIDRWREEDAHLKTLGINSGLSRPAVGSMMWGWHQELMPKLKEDVIKSQKVETREKQSRLNEDYVILGPYLQLLPLERMSAITILSAMKSGSIDSADGGGVRLHTLVLAVGDGIYNEYVAMAFRNKKKNNNRNRRDNARVAKGQLGLDARSNSAGSLSSNEYIKMEWGLSIKVRLGAFLVSRLMDIAKAEVSQVDHRIGQTLRETQPVFFRTFRYVEGKRVGLVRMNPLMIETLAKAPLASAISKYLPMVCEPEPWTGYSEGGFLDYRVPVVRLSAGDTQSREYAHAASENGDMAQIFAGLDVLAKTPWKINPFVFNTMLEAWNSGEAIAKIPPEEFPDVDVEPLSIDDPQQRYKRDRKLREIENHRAGLKSQRCFQNFQLEVARAYLGETFYFPHNCDFRGRAYPMTPFLNHMSADNVRGMLVFAQGKELTPQGLLWLKVHLANVYGYDKAGFKDRIHFTESHMAEIRESAENPLKGSRWWLAAEDPWQCLAACREVRNAFELPDPTRYICHLPIHQDGTCNGLQHYAALGGDAAGAQQVNLEPGDKPSDIYTAVAELVKADIAKDATRGAELAKELDGKVTRKVVKQTVMTNVYGVTFTGAKRQVRKQLDDLLVNFPDTDTVNLRYAAPYIAKKIFAALATMFNGAHDIQHWLTESAARISDSLAPDQIIRVEKAAKGEPMPHPYKRKHLSGPSKDQVADFKSAVVWTTPLKMPVVQPYRKKTHRRIETSLQKISIQDRSEADPIDKAKQVQAFPPNFIHSLDASHMFLTALKCHEVGLAFASIHDSFWTHAGDVDTMNRIIRGAFIRMHSEDIVGRLAAEFKARHKGYMQLATIRRDTAVGQKILAWRRQNAKIHKREGYKPQRTKKMEARKFDELLLERRRLDLLTSKDPKEREEGERMVTPGKIFMESSEEETRPSLVNHSLRTSKLQTNQKIQVGDIENVEPVQPLDDSVVHQKGSFTSRLVRPEALDAPEDVVEEVSADEEHESDHSQEPDPSQDQQPVRKKPVVTKSWLWLPLTFPPVPKKVYLFSTLSIY